MMNKITIIFSALFFFSACTKELPFPNLENADVLVMNGLISPETGVSLQLNQSCHVTDIKCIQKFVENAKVNLLDSNNGLLTELTYSSDGFYHADGFAIESKKEYKIEAISAGFETIKSNTSTPDVVDWELLSNDEEIYLNYLCRTFEIEIKDNPNEENYYLINGSVDILNGEHDEDIENELNGYIVPHIGFISDDIFAENTSLTSNTDYVALPLDFVFLTDENFNGQNYKLKFGLQDYDLTHDKDFELKAHIRVKSVNKELYEYYKSMALYRLTIGSFISEPVQIYSNVENGLGIFGGFSQKEISVDLPKSEYWFHGNMSIENDGCTAPCKVKFSAEMGSKVNFIWDFGDGNTSEEMQPEHTYEKSGEYEVTLSASMGNDHRGSSTVIQIK